MHKVYATKEEWLEWFWRNADFGPAHEEVMHDYEALYEMSTGRTIPKEWSVRYEK